MSSALDLQYLFESSSSSDFLELALTLSTVKIKNNIVNYRNKE